MIRSNRRSCLTRCCFLWAALFLISRMYCLPDGVSALTSSGERDTSFGDEGWVTVDLGGDEWCMAVAREPQNNRIIAAGCARTEGDWNFLLMQFKHDGSRMTSFGEDSVVTTDFHGEDDRIFAIALQKNNGKIVVAGYASNGGQRDFALARYTSDGTLDNEGFGVNGRVVTDFAGYDDSVYALVIQEDGKIVVGGYSTTPNGRDFTLVRYNSDGSIDTGFGEESVGGKVIIDYFGQDDCVTSLGIQADGKLVAAGYVTGANGKDFAVVRFLADGKPDQSFGVEGGMVVTDFTGKDDAIQTLHLPGDGTILTGGYTVVTIEEGEHEKDVVLPALARYRIGNGALYGIFGKGGTSTREYHKWLEGCAVMCMSIFYRHGEGDISPFSVKANWTEKDGGDITVAKYTSYVPYLYLEDGVFFEFPNGFGNSALFALTVYPDNRVLLGGVKPSVDDQNNMDLSLVRIWPFYDFMRHFWNPDCFIATAAYGSSLAREVDALRRFRDRYLLAVPAGRHLVRAYYMVSPPAASLIREDESLRSAVRSMLDPIILLLKVIEDHSSF